jgi:aminoglycoside phosphotransferase (APT) family kinase protein
LVEHSLATIQVRHDRQIHGTRPITEKDGLDTARLATWMKDHVAGFSGELQVEQFKGGQSNPTFLLSAPADRKYVMRRKPPGKLLPSARTPSTASTSVISALAKYRRAGG